MNGDGKLDLVVPGFAGIGLSGTVTVFTGNGDGTFRPGVIYPGGAGTAAVGDFNGDKKNDIASPDTRSAVTILLNTGVVSFLPTTPMTFPAQLVGTTGPYAACR